METSVIDKSLYKDGTDFQEPLSCNSLSIFDQRPFFGRIMAILTYVPSEPFVKLFFLKNSKVISYK